MRLTTIFLLLFIIHALNAQQWFETGDVWVQKEYNGLAGYEGYEERTIVGDTVVNNLNAKIIDVNGKGVSLALQQNYESSYRTVVREEADRVYHWDGEEYQLIYDFNLLPGDTIYYAYNEDGCQDSVQFVLKDTSSMVLGNQTLSVQDFELYIPYWDYYGDARVIQKIGFVDGHFNVSPSFACYTDATGYLQCSFKSGQDSIMFLEEPCYDLPVSTHNLIENLVSISPNPAWDRLFISGHKEGYTYMLVSTNGRQSLIDSNNSTIQIHGVVPGIYSLLIKNEKGKLLSIEKVLVLE